MRALMAYYDGGGAAQVLAFEGDALLLERASDTRHLIELTERDRDDDATRIICATVARLHAPRTRPRPADLVPLHIWFRELEQAGVARGGIFAKASVAAHELLALATEPIVLHGDIHHGNILWDETRGWVAIDPKGLLGDRAFDYANILCNPDSEIAAAPGRLQRRAAIVAQAAGLEPDHLMKWALAFAGLSAVWSVMDGEDAEPALSVAEAAANC
ncbi:MAG: aminoglycoside phosphotransferase family protein [Caulobacteraceae bacterium]